MVWDRTLDMLDARKTQARLGKSLETETRIVCLICRNHMKYSRFIPLRSSIFSEGCSAQGRGLEGTALPWASPVGGSCWAVH